MKAPTTFSIVIPVYNSEKTLPRLIERLSQVLPGFATTYEVILVNDGSRDQSWSVIEALTAQYPFVHGINLMRNYGQHNALLGGIRAAQYEVIVTMDDDLQNPPEEIPKMLAKLQEGYDVVYGVPDQQQHGLFRNLASAITKLALQNAMGVRAASKVSAFRMFRTYVRQAFAHYHAPLVSIEVLLTWGTSSFSYVVVQHDARTEGKSNYTFRKLVNHAINTITGFSVLPLQVASLLGFLFLLFGIFVLVYVIGRYLILGYSVPGFPFLASLVTIFSGVQLFSLGIIGEYLARLYKQSLQQPAYSIKQAIEPTQGVSHEHR